MRNLRSPPCGLLLSLNSRGRAVKERLEMTHLPLTSFAAQWFMCAYVNVLSVCPTLLHTKITTHPHPKLLHTWIILGIKKVQNGRIDGQVWSQNTNF